MEVGVWHVGWGGLNPGVSNRWKPIIGNSIDQSISIDKIS